jgi:hypothetical protein
VVFFDDYANTMIVGPTMQPICDRLRISRAKLAYIVDSTAAPVASIALVGTWVGAELDFIREGLNAVAAAGTPEFLAGVNAWQAFVRSIPYRFYAVLAIVWWRWLPGRGATSGRCGGRKRRRLRIPKTRPARRRTLPKHRTGCSRSFPSVCWWA